MAIQGSANPCTVSESYVGLHSGLGLQVFAAHIDCALELNSGRRLQTNGSENLARREGDVAEFVKLLKVTVAGWAGWDNISHSHDSPKKLCSAPPQMAGG